MEKENCEMHGRVSKRFILLNERPLDGFSWSGGRLTRKQTTSRPTMYGQICGSTRLMHQNAKRSKKWAIEKPKLDNARQLRGIFFIEPDN